MSGTLRAIFLLLGLAACEESRSKDAKLDTHRMLVEDLEAERHPADGGGRAFLDPRSPRSARVGETLEVAILYEAGRAGIAEGGALFLQPSPFWGWDSPQTEVPQAPGYTQVSTDAAGVDLASAPLAGLLAIHVRGRKLEEGERVRITYRTRTDRFAERNERIWIAVDGDGDGVRSLLPDSPTVDVLPGRPARLVLTLPTTARPGEIVRLALAVLDAGGNRGADFEREVRLDFTEGLRLPETVSFTRADRGVRAVEGATTGEGVYRVRASAADGLEGESNPLVVGASIPRVLWGDLHGDSQLSDGTGTPEDYFLYARDVAALDVVALTDHDHWGMRFLDANPGLWKVVEDTARRFHEPGRFVTLLGYEWTSWIHGHRHVLYFDGEGEVLSVLDPRYETPELLWRALEGRAAITFAHHSAGGPVSTNWDFVPPPQLEPLTEIVSVHGSSEAADSPGTIYSPVPGNYVRDILDRGLRFGFVGSGDGHDGHPGLAHLAAPSGGLAAIFAEERTAATILESFRSRRTYATNGPRLWLRTWLDNEPMGSILPPSAESQELRFAVAATAPVERIDLVRTGAVVLSIPGKGRRELFGTIPLGKFQDREYVYVRIIQEDGGAAWSSPYYLDAARPVKR